MILYYSATGNSAYAARYMGKQIGDEVQDLFPRLREGDTAPIFSQRPFVLVAPTFAWQMPHLVRDWLRGAELTGSEKIYFVLTCGDSMGNAGKYAEKLCKELGKVYMGCASLVMPENYIALFQAPGAEEAMELVEKAESRMEALADALRQGVPFPEEKPGLGGRFCSAVVNPLFYRWIIGDKKFTATESCNGCGYCERVCPLCNIAMQDGKPTWKGNCTHCMACICTCPKEAIEYGRGTRGKLRYSCPKK